MTGSSASELRSRSSSLGPAIVGTGLGGEEEWKVGGSGVGTKGVAKKKPAKGVGKKRKSETVDDEDWGESTKRRK